MKLIAIIAASLLALAPSVAAATDIGFTYSGVDPDDRYVTSAGAGTISFTGTGALTLANLTGFSFGQTTTLSDPSLMGTGSFSYGLADLLSFSGVYANGSLSSLALKTRTAADPTGFLADQSFQVRSLASNRASTAFDNAGSDRATVGTVRIIAAVPEPAAWTTLILGFGLVGFAMRRHRKGAGRAALAL